jgi:hypothetical protein
VKVGTSPTEERVSLPRHHSQTLRTRQAYLKRRGHTWSGALLVLQMSAKFNCFYLRLRVLSCGIKECQDVQERDARGTIRATLTKTAHIFIPDVGRRVEKKDILYVTAESTSFLHLIGWSVCV